MSLLLKDTTKKYILDWNESREFLQLSTFSLTTWNTLSQQYNTVLDSVKKIGSPDYGNMFDFSSGLTTTILLANTYYLLNCNTTSTFIKGFTHTNGRLTKINDAFGPIKLEGNIAVTGSNNDEIHVNFFKNGISISSSLGSMVLDGGGKGNTIPFHCITEMNNGDYIEVYISNTSGGRNVTLENMNIILTEII